MRLVPTGLLSLSLLALFASNLSAHGGAYLGGGTYTGPRDVVPPASGPKGGVVGPGAPAPTGGSGAGPTTPGPAGPGPGPGRASGTGGRGVPLPGAAGRAAGPRTGGGIVLEMDLTAWHFWWEFNKSPFIRLKDAIHDWLYRTPIDGYERLLLALPSMNVLIRVLSD